MGDQLREGDVTTAGDSVVEYARYCQLRDAGDAGAAQGKLQAICEYNEYDCDSTLGLRDWLLGLAAEAGVQAGVVPPIESTVEGAAADEAELHRSTARVRDPADR